MKKSFTTPAAEPDQTECKEEKRGESASLSFFLYKITKETIFRYFVINNIVDFAGANDYTIVSRLIRIRHGM